jgi:hypothetical protein
MPMPQAARTMWKASDRPILVLAAKEHPLEPSWEFPCGDGVGATTDGKRMSCGGNQVGNDCPLWKATT